MLRITGRVPRGFRAGGFTRGAALITVVLCVYGAGVVTGAEAPSSSTRPQRGPLDEAAERIAEESALPVDRAELQRAAVNGMLQRLGDRWARYYTATEYDDTRGRLNGRYSGVGLWLGVEEGSGRVLVASVQPESAAERAGVRVGDAITGIGDRKVGGWTVSKVAAALRGAPGTSVTLTVLRKGAERRFTLVRSAVQTGDVTVEQRSGSIRVIRVAAFTRGVGRQVREAVERPAGGAESGLILDLRGNPGGLLEEAVETSSALLSDGVVAVYERRGERPRELRVTEPGDGRTPLVVLVDAGTASAAEVVAGSLRDRDRAVLVGSRTYGKGSVQEPVRLQDGSVIELTVGRYRTPGGRDLDGTGIEPDVAVSADRPPEEALERAGAVLRGLMASASTKDRR